MCQFKSGIVLKNGTILSHLDFDSHEQIIEHYHLKDDGIKNDFVRVEIIPRGKTLTEAIEHLNLKTWKLHVDQDNIPDWWKATEKHAEKEMLKILKDNVKKRWILRNKSIEEIKDGQNWYVCGKVNHVSGSATINYVSGSATINSVSGSATINYVYGSATINSVYGSATINYVYDSATINSVSGSATINHVSGSATIKDVKDNSVILISRDNGKLKIRTALEVEVVK